MGRKVSGKEDLVAGAESDQEEDALAQNQPEGEARSEKDDALRFAERPRGLAAVKRPDRDQVQHIQEGAGARERGPERIASLLPQDGAGHGGEKSGERPRQADGGAGLL